MVGRPPPGSRPVSLCPAGTAPLVPVPAVPARNRPSATGCSEGRRPDADTGMLEPSVRGGDWLWGDQGSWRTECAWSSPRIQCCSGRA
ncbi:hypothetical protein GBW32_21970 [Streptomyces tsukubensis]|nr:hypothetical protein GBW32_21970 [Streptomyces tsukubensis]